MLDDNILILTGDDILSILTGREIEIMGIIQSAYETHAKGYSSLPHSTFLRFPAEPGNRIIALPAFLGDDFQIAGMKWIASFPGNRSTGFDRASAVLILNSTETGRPVAMIEGSVISAKRTAASAALAARHLYRRQTGDSAGFIGCGPINLEVWRFILADQPGIRRLLVFDTDLGRARQFQEKAEELSGELEVRVAADVESVLRESSLVCLATTAAEPHIFDLSCCAPGTTILHVSLRDLAPEVVLACDNIVDDVDHVCRAQTSLHLAELQTGNRNFIRCTLGDMLLGKADAPEAASTVVFSPFGLGILDIALGKAVCDIASGQGRGIAVSSFLPAPWTRPREGASTALRRDVARGGK